MEHLIRTFTDINDVVIDPCAGSGTTLLACKNLGRKGFGFEIKREYVRGFYETILPTAQADTRKTSKTRGVADDGSPCGKLVKE